MKGVRKSKILLIMHLLIAVCLLSSTTQAQYGGETGEQNNPSPADGSMNPDKWAILIWSSKDTAISYDVYFGEEYNDVEAGTSGTFHGKQTSTFYIVGVPGFAYPEGLVPGTTYYWRIDEVNDNEPNSPWMGPVWSFSISPRTAYNPDPADSAESVRLYAKLSWTPGFGAKLHSIYFSDNFDEVNNAAVGIPQVTATYNPGPLELAKTYYWRVDEFDGVDTHKGDIWNFFTQGVVGSPNPSNGAVDIERTPILTWTCGIYADTHQVYLGKDKEAVKNANTNSPEYKGSGNLGSESHAVSNLEWNTTYYWRIDEFNNTNPDSPWRGPVWSFTVGNFIVVDDFESYNDLDTGDPASNRIYLTWIDGFDNPEINGSVVGESNPPFVYFMLAHTGKQSMPYYYDNTGPANYSEATANVANLKAGQDWTKHGIKTLSLWFRRFVDSDPWFGNSKNDPEPMCVSLANTNGPTAVVYHDDPNVTQVIPWTEWRIDLQEFSAQGVDLTNINTITIGFGDKKNPVVGGRGKMWFDDIRLCRPTPK